jgi:hypothetical protein
MPKKLKDSNATLKVYGFEDITGIITDEKYERLLQINPAYADLFETSYKAPEPLFVKAEPVAEKTETKPKSKPTKDDIQA